MKQPILAIACNFLLCSFALASTIDLECSYKMQYSKTILDASMKYVALGKGKDSSTYNAAEFYMKDSKNNDSRVVELSIDTHNKKVVDSLLGCIAFEDAILELKEYTDKIFIGYRHKKRSANDHEYLVERIVIDRKSGSFSGERYDSYSGLNQQVFPNGELVYTMLGTCKPLQRLF